MRQKCRLFVQRHDNGTYTVTAPGIHHVSVADEWDEAAPAAPSLAAYGLTLEEAKDDVRIALEKWLGKVDVELRPSDRHGRKRHDQIRIKFSLLLTKEDSGQYLISVPKLTAPPLSFYCYKLDELRDAATRELSAYFSDHALEDLLDYQHQRQELLDEIEVSFTPLKPHKEKKKKEEDQKSALTSVPS